MIRQAGTTCRSFRSVKLETSTYNGVPGISLQFVDKSQAQYFFQLETAAAYPEKLQQPVRVETDPQSRLFFTQISDRVLVAKDEETPADKGPAIGIILPAVTWVTAGDGADLGEARGTSGAAAVSPRGSTVGVETVDVGFLPETPSCIYRLSALPRLGYAVLEVFNFSTGWMGTSPAMAVRVAASSAAPVQIPPKPLGIQFGMASPMDTVLSDSYLSNDGALLRDYLSAIILWDDGNISELFPVLPGNSWMRFSPQLGVIIVALQKKGSILASGTQRGAWLQRLEYLDPISLTVWRDTASIGTPWATLPPCLPANRPRQRCISFAVLDRWGCVAVGLSGGRSKPGILAIYRREGGPVPWELDSSKAQLFGSKAVPGAGLAHRMHGGDRTLNATAHRWNILVTKEVPAEPRLMIGIPGGLVMADEKSIWYLPAALFAGDRLRLLTPTKIKDCDVPPEWMRLIGPIERPGRGAAQCLLPQSPTIADDLATRPAHFGFGTSISSTSGDTSPVTVEIGSFHGGITTCAIPCAIKLFEDEESPGIVSLMNSTGVISKREIVQPRRLFEWLPGVLEGIPDRIEAKPWTPPEDPELEIGTHSISIIKRLKRMADEVMQPIRETMVVLNPAASATEYEGDATEAGDTAPSRWPPALQRGYKEAQAIMDNTSLRYQQLERETETIRRRVASIKGRQRDMESRLRGLQRQLTVAENVAKAQVLTNVLFSGSGGQSVVSETLPSLKEFWDSTFHPLIRPATHESMRRRRMFESTLERGSRRFGGTATQGDLQGIGGVGMGWGFFSSTASATSSPISTADHKATDLGETRVFDDDPFETTLAYLVEIEDLIYKLNDKEKGLATPTGSPDRGNKSPNPSRQPSKSTEPQLT